MGFWLPFLMATGTVLQIGGALQQGEAAAAAGAAQQQAAEYEARQMEVGAGQAIAASQRAAQEQRRQAKLVASRALALAAASGAGAADPTVVDIIGDITGEGAYRAAVALYEGEEQARTMRAQAKATRYGGAVAEAGGRTQRQAAQIGAFGSLLAGAGSLYEKYGIKK